MNWPNLMWLTHVEWHVRADVSSQLSSLEGAIVVLSFQRETIRTPKPFWGSPLLG